VSLLGRALDILRVFDSLLTRCNEVETVLDRIQQKAELVIMAAKSAKELLEEVDAATNDVAARIQALLDQIGGDTSATELAELKTGVQAQIDRLRTMGTGGQIEENP